MPRVEILEEIIKSFLKNDLDAVMSILDKEITHSSKIGNNTVARRLRNLVNIIPQDKSYYPQSNNRPSKGMVILDNPLVDVTKSNVFLTDVILNESQKKIIINLLAEWSDYKKLTKYNIFPSNRLLFYGAPGTGKTKLAHAIASQLNYPLVTIRLDELISSFLGKTGKNIRDIFELARVEKVVIFLDEIDTIAKHRDDSKDLGELKRVVTVLLQNIDNFPPHSILIGATNHESLLDNAVWRRFNLKIQFNLPSEEERTSLFKLFFSNYPNKIDYKILARITEGLNGSSIRDLSEDVIKRAILEGNKEISTIEAVIIIIESISSNFLKNKTSKKSIYEILRILRVNGYSIRDISNITGIPYTTLHYHIK